MESLRSIVFYNRQNSFLRCSIRLNGQVLARLWRVGRWMFDVHQFLVRSDWALAASAAAYMKLD